MQTFPRYISWPEIGSRGEANTTRMLSKEYRSFRANGEKPEDWPGVEVLEVPNRETAIKLVSKGIPEAAQDGRDKVFGGPQRGVRSNDTGCSVIRNPDTYSSISSSSSKNNPGSKSPAEADNSEMEHPKESDEAFAVLPMETVRAAVPDPATRLLLTLARLSKMRGWDKIKLSRQIWEEAGIRCRSERSRALHALEDRRTIRVQRWPGQSPVVTVRLGQDRLLRPWPK
ncbi:hypothetical protein R3X27_22590 [Tropicimonas sp. TH_r6]|uniref:hypothetical protein n=1 Tax=Tropicimonas sp. TH_r6 TaxID=3082085 RepID=UPI0029529E9B|nr:hypothetical protein [Tropicimonas sp. TH_r6]MDV7145483.1 hypothetical protein [Tropicimonas sp. TH_r6]